MYMKKAQVSTEYLVILAVVLVIALVVVYLVSQGSSLGSGITETQAQEYWKGTSPFAVNGYSASATSLNLDMTNTQQEAYTITSISGTGITTFAVSTAFNPGQQRTVTLTLAATCGSAGTRYSYGNVTVTYTTSAALTKTFVAQKPLVGTCS